MESKLIRFAPEAVLGFCKYFDDNRPSRFLDFIRKSKLSNLLVELTTNRVNNVYCAGWVWKMKW